MNNFVINCVDGAFLLELHPVLNSRIVFFFCLHRIFKVVFETLRLFAEVDTSRHVSRHVLQSLVWRWLWWIYPTHSWGWGHGLTPRSPNNWANPHGRDQRSRSERVWSNTARRRWSSTGQSSTRCERFCNSEPQLLHEGVSAPPTL